MDGVVVESHVGHSFVGQVQVLRGTDMVHVVVVTHEARTVSGNQLLLRLSQQRIALFTEDICDVGTSSRGELVVSRVALLIEAH